MFGDAAGKRLLRTRFAFTLHDRALLRCPAEVLDMILPWMLAIVNWLIGVPLAFLGGAGVTAFSAPVRSALADALYGFLNSVLP